MRTSTVARPVLLAVLLSASPAVSRDGADWVDLLGRDLKDWTRLGTGKNPWRLAADGTLICTPATDAYAPDAEFWDGTLRFDYRFRPTGEKTGYRASVAARRSDSSAGCKVALGDHCGTITGTFVGASDAVKELEIRPTEKLGRPAGEWNHVELRMAGQTVRVTINGKVAGSWERCTSGHGLVNFEAEGSEIEFRSIHWKDGK